MGILDLSAAPGWAGWHFGPYGKARNHRLIGPNWTSFQPADIISGRLAVLDVDHLRTRVKRIERQLDGNALYLSTAEIHEIQRAVELLDRILPAKSSAKTSIAA